MSTLTGIFGLNLKLLGPFSLPQPGNDKTWDFRSDFFRISDIQIQIFIRIPFVAQKMANIQNTWVSEYFKY